MTNGEKILNAFPNATARICKNKGFTYIEVEQNDKWIADFDIEWWNAEFKEPTTQERQAESDKFDAAFQDGYNHGYAQARFDYEQEPRKDEVILTKEEYGELVSSEFDNGYAKGYREALEQESVLNKIRAEIEQVAFKDVSGSKFIFVNRVNQILEKYKAENDST